MLIFHKKRNIFAERKFKIFGPLFLCELMCDLSFSISFAIPYSVFLYNQEVLGPFCGGPLLDFAYWNVLVNLASGAYSALALIFISIMFMRFNIKRWLQVLEVCFWMRYLIHIPALIVYFGLFYAVIYGAVCNVLNVLTIIYLTIYSFLLFFSAFFSFRRPDNRFIDSISEEEDEKLILRRRK